MTERRVPAFRSRAEAAFIALAAGDALGWPQEFPSKVLGGGSEQTATTAFRPWVRRGGGRFYPHEEHIQAGEYSDDTQLVLAVARCRMLSGTSWWGALTRTELPLWTLYERGGGGATKRATEMWIKGMPPWRSNDSRAVRRYFDAGGNGVTMRVLPHAIFYACEADPTPLMRDVVTDGVATHGHPRALVGATAYAFAAWWLLRSEQTIRFGELVQVLLENAAVWGALPATNPARNGWLDAADRSTPNGYEAAWSTVVGEMRDLFHRVERGLNAGAIADDDEILRDLGCFGKAKGAGTVSTAAAVYLCARYAAQPVQAVLKAAFARKADTDTIAAMSGGLVGCLAGQDWLPPEWKEVQDYEYLRRMANQVAQGPSAAQHRPAGLRTIGQRELDSLRAVLVEGHRGSLDLDGIRHAEVVDLICPTPLSKSTVAQVWQLRTSDGQTIYVTKLGRRSKTAGPREPELQTSGRPPMLRTDGHAVPLATAAGLKLTVTDIKAMAAFYEGVLGLRPGKRSHRFVSYGALSLVDAQTAADLSGGAVDPKMDARRHRIQVHVSDLDAAYRRVQQLGGRVAQPITEMPWRERVFHCV
ncbi:MAG TPA: hypothetical protein ENK62_07505, partial [Chromatiales bacterium]|nr:hypothetical protein [Chromatiales bacterium]